MEDRILGGRLFPWAPGIYGSPVFWHPLLLMRSLLSLWLSFLCGNPTFLPGTVKIVFLFLMFCDFTMMWICFLLSFPGLSVHLPCQDLFLSSRNFLIKVSFFHGPLSVLKLISRFGGLEPLDCINLNPTSIHGSRWGFGLSKVTSSCVMPWFWSLSKSSCL